MNAVNPQATQRVEALKALSHFFNLATRHSNSAARVAARMLLGLYNGERFQFDLTDLRRFDAANLDRALVLLRFDANPGMEVHQWLNKAYGRTDFGERFEHMAHAWRLKGRCKKEYLVQVDRIGELKWGGAQ